MHAHYEVPKVLGYHFCSTPFSEKKCSASRNSQLGSAAVRNKGLYWRLRGEVWKVCFATTRQSSQQSPLKSLISLSSSLPPTDISAHRLWVPRSLLHDSPPITPIHLQFSPLSQEGRFVLSLFPLFTSLHPDPGQQVFTL